MIDPGPIGVLIVDDHALFAEGLSAVLGRAPDIRVIGIAATADEAVRIAHEARPRVVLMDHHLPGLSGVDAARRIIADGPACVVMLSGGATEEEMLEAVEAGVSGYLSKTARVDEVAAAVRRAASGEMLVPASLLAELLAVRRRQSVADAERHAIERSLTARERDVLALMTKGHDTKTIADELVLSVNTVRGHVQTIIEKLGVHSRLEAVVLAGHLGLVPR